MGVGGGSRSPIPQACRPSVRGRVAAPVCLQTGAARTPPCAARAPRAERLPCPDPGGSPALERTWRPCARDPHTPFPEKGLLRAMAVVPGCRPLPPLPRARAETFPLFTASLGLLLGRQLLQHPDPKCRVFRTRPSPSSPPPHPPTGNQVRCIEAASSGNTEVTDRPHRPGITWSFPCGPRSTAKYTFCC